MKRITLSILLLLATLCGCQSGKANAQKTLAGIQYAADATMKLWGGYVAREQRRCDLLPEAERIAGHASLLDRRLEVDDTRREFSAAWALAFSAARYDRSKPASEQVVALLTQLQNTVNQFVQ